ncbi:glucosamine-6-phosphate deaminase [Gottschalkiaceae bacterium SANA]|nr:glucosamine-6-phosphate deaminase [Gottschalkiaceae bacterium SANA]
MKIIVAKNYEELSRKAGNLFASQLILKSNAVIGLATGSSPVGMYKELIRIYRNGDIDFDEVVSFNLDEYIGLTPDNEQSYHYFMRENLFDHINIRPENIHIPSGIAVDMTIAAQSYDKMIEEAGGIDIQILGIGNNGHIGFNEPDVKFEARTHIVELEPDTIEANSRFFDSIDQVPTQAISMGIKNIMQSRKIVLIASGEGKAKVVQAMIEGPITPELPASVLQLHPDVTIILDQAAASLLRS